MARSSLIKVAFVVALTMAAGSAYGASVSISIPTAIGSGSFVPSNNVRIGVTATDSMFSANSKHFNGDRIIAFTSTDAKLYFSSGASVGSTATPPSAADQYSSCSAGGVWNSM